MNTSRFHTSICRITLIPKIINVFMKQGENIYLKKLVPKIILRQETVWKKYFGATVLTSDDSLLSVRQGEGIPFAPEEGDREVP